MSFPRICWSVFLVLLLWFPKSSLAVAVEGCPRPVIGSEVTEPDDLRSENGVLKVEIEYRTAVEPDGLRRFCFLTKDGSQAPNLRLKSGDLLMLTLKNNLPASEQAHHAGMHSRILPCTNSSLAADTTNLHFHGLVIAPSCHQDDTLNTAVRPSDSYEYKFKIPTDQPPGVYWYHPHIHGFTKVQVLGGASGALIVEGIETLNPEIRGLPERVFVVRDQDLLNPNADPISIDGLPPPMVFKDPDGDVMNTGTGTGKPAKDLSINFVSVPFPEYKPAVIRMRPKEKQFWRLLNASAITYVDVQLLYNEAPQPLGLVAIDGVSLNHENAKGIDKWRSHILLPPAGRAEFTVTGPLAGVHARLVTRSVDTGPVGDNDPVRPLANILVDANAPEPRSFLSNAKPQGRPVGYVPLREVKPVRTRLLYFSERPQDPKDPNSPILFFVTLDGQEPKQFDHNSTLPNITVHGGDVEDWIIENRSKELHAFHIHQIHFQLMEWNGVPISEPFLRDTVNVPYWREKMMTYPSVKLRMDFRDAKISGTFAYHCHLLEHQDGGMMGLIRVEPQFSAAKPGKIMAEKISAKSKTHSSN